MSTSSPITELVAGWLAGRTEEATLVAALRAEAFTDDDAVALTRLLADSGDHLDLSDLGPWTVDKHSTGGVADSTTLLAVPLLAAAGARVVKLSGRGLGHTGGTIDKLEAIPGLRTDLAGDELLAIAEDVGCVVAAQSDRLVPGDRALYALRHATDTVASPALIASSVMAKKLAAGAATIVLDVKAGDGAFMRSVDDAVELARLCTRIGWQAGRRCVALVTAMDEPLGRSVGNALEVAEAVELLAVPPTGRLAQLSVDLAAEGLGLARGGDAGEVRDELVARWRDGQALARLRAMVAAQGGDPAVCESPRTVLPAAPAVVTLRARRPGWVAAVPARGVGRIAAQLGAGRRGKHEPINPAVGVQLHVAVGEHVAPGEPLATVHAADEEAARHACAQLHRLVELADGAVSSPPTVHQRVDAGGGGSAKSAAVSG